MATAPIGPKKPLGANRPKAQNRLTKKGVPNRQGHRPPKKLTRANLLAVRLTADGTIPDTEIAKQIGIGMRSLTRWRTESWWDTQYQIAVADFLVRVNGSVFTLKERRIHALNQVAMKLIQVIHERASDSEVAGIPGGRTGLVVHRLKVIGFGSAAHETDEYEVDNSSVQTLLKVLDSIAVETGQKTTKVETNHEMGRSWIEMVEKLEAEALGR